jgi:spore coat polysaccharide biosynthesis protein SpsF
MDFGIVIIARQGSTRTPNKMLADVAGKPLLSRLIDRLERVQKTDRLVLATTCLPEDDALGELARQRGLQVYRGAVDDVIERMLGACQTFGLDFAIIAEGDELFCDPTYIDKSLETAEKTAADCVKTRDLPIGSWVVGVRRSALSDVYVTKGDSSTEAFSRLFTDDSTYRTEWIDPDSDLPQFDPNLRLTMDYEEDFKLANELYQRLERPGSSVSLKAVLELVRDEPSLVSINSFLNDTYWARVRSRIDKSASELAKGGESDSNNTNSEKEGLE